MTEQQDKKRHEALEFEFDDATGIATFTLHMDGRANKINRVFSEGLEQALTWSQEQEGLKGIIIESAHKDWCVGADIDMLFGQQDPAKIYDACMQLNVLFRRLETMAVPVVAALTGSALGGGYELALSCHRRIALDDARIQVGLPEVSLGVIPGAGGTQRLPRRIGVQASLEQIMQGKMVRPSRALKMGMIDEVADNRDALRTAAEAWIAANPKVKQPWDEKGFEWPGLQPRSMECRQIFIGASAMLFKKTAGSIPSPEIALRAVHDGAGLAFDRALEVEARYFAAIASSDSAQDMIRTFWYHRTAAEKCEGLPQVEDAQIHKVGILGAGMMGAGLAYICASKGLSVVVKDISDDALAKGKEHSEKQAHKRGKHLGAEGQKALLERIVWTLHVGDLEGCDLVIEAVFEDDELKGRVTREVEPCLAQNGIFASNTSAIPITHLAKASAHPSHFIGLHFFSPVEQMPLLEIIMGEHTSDETLARSLGFARRLGKLPIVVNDGYGFFTSRVFASYLLEAVQLVAEGHDPALIEWAARTAGMVVSPLKVFDEVSLKLGRHGLTQRERYVGEKVNLPGIDLLKLLVDDHGRLGKAAGAGFYEYDGRESRIWAGLSDLVNAKPEVTGLEYLQSRLMYAQIAEVGRTLDDGILRHHRDAEVGGIFGIGFAPASGGPLAWINRRGLRQVVQDLQQLASICGERYAPATTLIAMAETNQSFFNDSL